MGGTSLLVTTTASAAANVVGGAINNVIQGKDITPKSVLTDAAVGSAVSLGGKVLDKIVKRVAPRVRNVIDEKRVSHIFRDAEGHITKDTPSARNLVTKTANNSKKCDGYK